MTLHVERHGDGEDLVLLHGWGLHSGAWGDAVPMLARRFRVHAIDLPGHGRSSTCRAASLDAAVDTVMAAMPPRAVVCGWSLGGLVAQRLAAREPGRVRALALVASTPCFVARDGWTAGMPRSDFDRFADGFAADARAALEGFVRLNALGGPAPRETIRRFTARLDDRGAPDRVALASALGWLRDADLRGDASRLAMPVAIVHGTGDAVTPVDAARWMGRAVPSARLAELPGCGHLPFDARPAEFAAALEALHG